MPEACGLDECARIFAAFESFALLFVTLLHFTLTHYSLQPTN